MSTRIILSLATTALLAGAGCYQDDTPAAPQNQKPVTKALLTDAPFPYDSVASVNVYVVRVEASTGWAGPDSGEWVLIAEPKKSFNLLTLQRGTTAFLGEEELPAGQYHMIRMTIDTSLSSIIWSGGTARTVHWQNLWESSEMPLYASVEYPVDVPTEGAEIVIDFDLGRSFLYDFYGTGEFTFIPHLRAINSAATGAIAGTVTTPSSEGDQPVQNASVYVEWDGPCACDPPNSRPVVATGRTDGAGSYKVAFVRAGTYMVRIEPPYPFLETVSTPLETVSTPNVHVTAGATTTLSVSLPKAGADGAYIRISGPTSVGVGGTVTLIAAVGDANGEPVANPSVSWTSSDTTIAEVTGVGDTASVTGRQPGLAAITAASDGLSDSHTIQVLGAPAPVATVTVEPGSADLAVGDTAAFVATARDSAGNRLDRAISWFGTDSSVFVLEFSGSVYAQVRAWGAGTVFLRATSEGKIGQATIAVH